jgi:hypothetical protein
MKSLLKIDFGVSWEINYDRLMDTMAFPDDDILRKEAYLIRYDPECEFFSKEDLRLIALQASKRKETFEALRDRNLKIARQAGMVMLALLLQGLEGRKNIAKAKRIDLPNGKKVSIPFYDTPSLNKAYAVASKILLTQKSKGQKTFSKNLLSAAWQSHWRQSLILACYYQAIYNGIDKENKGWLFQAIVKFCPAFIDVLLPIDVLIAKGRSSDTLFQFSNEDADSIPIKKAKYSLYPFASHYEEAQKILSKFGIK